MGVGVVMGGEWGDGCGDGVVGCCCVGVEESGKLES